MRYTLKDRLLGWWRTRRHDQGATSHCQCGAPATTVKRSPYPTPYRPSWGYCDDHADLSLSHPWNLVDGRRVPADDFSITDTETGETVEEWIGGVRFTGP